jgi:hypothetical protein
MGNDFDIIRFLQFAGPTYGLMLIALLLILNLGTRKRK